MGRRNTGNLKPASRDYHIRAIGSGLEAIPNDSAFMEILRSKDKSDRALTRELAAIFKESHANFAVLHPDEARTAESGVSDITPAEFEAAGFPRAAEMVRLLGFEHI